MEKLSRILSTFFSPVLIPTYGIIFILCFSYISYINFSTKLGVIGMTFFLTALLPFSIISILYKLGKISDIGVNQQKDRLIPFIASIICYISFVFYLYFISAPIWMIAFAIGATIAAIITCIVNIWWKISGHCTGMGGLIALSFIITAGGIHSPDINPMLLFSIIVLLAGIVGTSRLILNRHTLGQVIAGTANGIISMFIALLII